MKIEWVNHASFIIDYDGVRLITDPWMEGTAFDNGWALLSKTVLKFEDFKDITHIWFSHEHPDHFSPPNINKIPKEYKKNITVLFQATVDRKVPEYCNKAGFKEVIEMQPDTFYNLSSKIKCMCNPFTDGDSYLYLVTDKLKLLNINDCIINTKTIAEKIKEKTGDVDLLFTQFGYANKVGNINDDNLRQEASDEKLRRIKIQYEVLQPKVIVPFASYVYFCHEENKYMNGGVNRIGRVYDFITSEMKAKAVVLYPGEVWNVDEEHDSRASVAKYNADYKRLDDGEVAFLKSDKVELNKLQEQAKVFVKKIKDFNKNMLLNLLRPLNIYVEDYAQAFQFSFSKGLVPANTEKHKCDISLNSQTLLYCFTFLWGGDTMQINARFQTEAQGDYMNVRIYFGLASDNNRGNKWTSRRLLGELVASYKRYYIRKGSKF